MKKWMTFALIGAVTAGMAAAETNSIPWYKKIFVKNAGEETQVIPPPPQAPAPAQETPQMQRPQLTPEQVEKVKARKAGGTGDRRPQPTPEQVEKMKAQHEALMKLGEAARNETDPAKKEELIGQLRAQLTEISDKMQAEQQKRLDQAEKELPRLRARLADAEKNKSARIEEQIQKILAGEPFGEKEGKRPQKPGGGKNKKAAKKTPAE